MKTIRNMMFVNSLGSISIFDVKLVNRLDLRLNIKPIFDWKIKKGITD